jgi:hypothetical protein
MSMKPVDGGTDRSTPAADEGHGSLFFAALLLGILATIAFFGLLAVVVAGG